MYLMNQPASYLNYHTHTHSHTTLHLFLGCSRLWRYMNLTRRRFISFDLHTIVVVIERLESAHYDTSRGTHTHTHSGAQNTKYLSLFHKYVHYLCTIPAVATQ